MSRRSGLTAVAGLLLAALPTSAAHADPAVKRFEHSTDIYCATSTDDLSVTVGTNRNVSAEGVQTYAFAAISNDDGSLDAYGEATDVLFEGGRLDATVELVDHDGQSVGQAHLAGTYTVGAGETFRGRPLKLIGNQYMVQTTTVAPVAVAWETLDVAGVQLVAGGTTVMDPSCDTYDMIRQDTLTSPHRLSFQAEGYAMTEPCSPAPLTEVAVVPSESGLSLLLFGAGELFGETNVDVSAAGPQLLQWWLPGAEEPVGALVTVAFADAGTPRTDVVNEDGRTIRTTTRPQVLTFTAGLPDGGTVSAACGIDHTTTRIVVEPVDGERR